MTPTAETPADRLVLEAVGLALSALPANARIAVAFSGGVDSTVLLDAAVRVAGASRCVALHVHHGLSPHADAWLAHCEAFARERGVEFAARRVEVSRDAGVSVEAAARDARYRALDAMCAARGVQTLWLAQHADDQAETVLLQLLRGAGLAGLAAMAPESSRRARARRACGPCCICCARNSSNTRATRALRWIDDESNADTRYARNALRHEVTPALAVHFPGFRDALARTAAHAASAQRLLDELARIDMDAASRGRRARALARCAARTRRRSRTQPAALLDAHAGARRRHRARVSTDALRQLREVGAAGEGHRLRVDHAGHALRSYRGLVYWEAGDSSEPADETALAARAVSELAWQGESIWRLPQWRGTFVFASTLPDAALPPRCEPPTANLDSIPVGVLQRALLSARSRSGGERMRTSDAPSAPSRTLKNLFQERGIPAWKRDVPLLYVGDELLFVPLLGVNRAALTEQADRGRSARQNHLARRSADRLTGRSDCPIERAAKSAK